VSTPEARLARVDAALTTQLSASIQRNSRLTLHLEALTKALQLAWDHCPRNDVPQAVSDQIEAALKPRIYG
jgi:hypothetical protein